MLAYADLRYRLDYANLPYRLRWLRVDYADLRSMMSLVFNARDGSEPSHAQLASP